MICGGTDKNDELASENVMLLEINKKITTKFF